MERKIVWKERMDACKNHPEKAEIFWLEQMLLEYGKPYFFNLWEDLRPVFGADEGDPEKDINWDTYKFLIDVGEPAGRGLSTISVCFSTGEKPELLELLDMRPAKGLKNPTAMDGTLHTDISAEQAMEIIKDYYEKP